MKIKNDCVTLLYTYWQCYNVIHSDLYIFLSQVKGKGLLQKQGQGGEKNI